MELWNFNFLLVIYTFNGGFEKVFNFFWDWGLKKDLKVLFLRKINECNEIKIEFKVQKYKIVEVQMTGKSKWLEM